MRLSDTEWNVMLALWQRTPATAREIHAEVVGATHWSYSTVRTLLARLVEKGAVAEVKRGNQGVYTPLVTREAARRSALRTLVDRAFGGRLGSLVQYMAEEERLSPAERAELQRLLAGGETPSQASMRRRKKKS